MEDGTGWDRGSRVRDILVNEAKLGTYGRPLHIAPSDIIEESLR